MATSLHKDLDYGELHKPINYQYADATARTTATGFTTADLGKFAWQLDDNTIWMLTATTPTWIQVTAMGAEANTASNIGVGGVGVFDGKVGSDLQFKNINAGSAKVTVTDDVVNNEVDIDVVDAQIDHDALNNFVANEHVDHSSVSINGGTGISGGGDITASRTLDLDINSLTEDATPDAANDFVATYDASAPGIRKVRLSNLAGDSVDYQNVTGTASAPQSVNLPASPTLGDLYSYRDADGNASVNPITYNGNGNTINGETSCVMNADYGVLLFRFGTEWEIR